MSPVEGEATSKPAQARSHSGRDLDFEAVIGSRIKAARLAAGMNQRVLGEAVGIAYQKLQKYELGKDRIAVSTLQRIARALNVHPGSFFEDPISKIGSGALDVMVARRSIELIQALPDVDVAGKLLVLIDELGKGGAKTGDRPLLPLSTSPVVSVTEEHVDRAVIRPTRAVIDPLVKVLQQAGMADAGGLARLLGQALAEAEKIVRKADP